MAHDKHNGAERLVDGKVCTKCGEEKPLEDFHRRSDRSDGRQNRCKSCFAEYHKAKTEDQREAARAARRASYAADSRPRLEQIKKWQEKNPEKVKGYVRKYRQENPHIAWEAKYRTRCASFDVTPVVVSFTREDLVAAYGDACVDCGGEWSELDHVLPVMAGGEHSIENCRPVCHACNCRRWTNFQRAAVAHYSAHLRATTERPS